MTHSWQRLGAVAPGGAVLKIAGDPDKRLWLASPAGLFTQNGADWRSVMRGIPFWRINTLVASGNSVVVAGLPNGLIRSTNNGRSWQNCIIEQTEAPVLSLAISPRFQTDRLIFAGTDGDGILRSTDGGRRWQLANFGLRDFTILELATAPVWDRREFVFAISEAAVYQSPNAGRAWRKAELPADCDLPSAMAVSPDFIDNQTVYLGCEDGRILISTDAGRRYNYMPQEQPLAPINAMAFNQEGILLLGTMSGIVQLDTASRLTTTVTQMDQPILSLSSVGQKLFAGRLDHLFQSKANEWSPVESLAARRFVWYETPTSKQWLASGPEEGVFVTEDAGQSWNCVWSETPVLAVAASKTHIWHSSPAGVQLSTDWGQNWQQVWQSEDLAIAMSGQGDHAWCGTQSGKLWHLTVDGCHELETPFGQGRILGLYSNENALVVAIWSRDHKEMQIWHYAAELWQCWLSKVSKPIMPQVAFTNADDNAILVGLETAIYRCTAEDVTGGKVTPATAPVSAILADSPTLAAITDRLISFDSTEKIEILSSSMDGNSIIFLAALADDSRYVAGSSDGMIYLTAQD